MAGAEATGTPSILEATLGLRLAIAFLLFALYLITKRGGSVGKGCELLCRAFANFLGMLMYDAWRLFWRLVGWSFRGIADLFRGRSRHP